jgi:hypothetical protein
VKILEARKKTSSAIIDRLIVTLFTLIGDECKASAKPSSKEGFSFEDRVSKKAYTYIRKYPVTVFPPRSTLNYPTVSGLKHQFDGIVMDENTFYVIECKKRGTAVIDQMFSFNAKILDYALKDAFASNFQIKGIFLCTAEVNENIRKYALAYGILPIDSKLPPIQVMIDQIHENDKLRSELIELKKLFMVPLPSALKLCRNGHELFQRFIICHQKWKSRGYE